MSVQLVLAQGWVVGVDSEARQTVIVHVDAPGLVGGDQNVNTEVEFQTVYQKRVLDVPAYDAMLINRHLRNVINLQHQVKGVFALTM